MMKERYLREALERIFKPWDGDFEIYLDSDPEKNNHYTGRATITHKDLGGTTSFPVQADWLGNCDMDRTGEGDWHPLSGANVFEYMWFVEARVRVNKHKDPEAKKAELDQGGL